MERPESTEELEKILKRDPFVVVDWYQRPDDDDVCEALVRALEDPHKIVRQAATKALIMMDDLYASTSIYGVLMRGSFHARMASIEVLGYIGKGDPLAIKYITHISRDPNKLIAGLAELALSRMTNSVRGLP